MPDRDQQQALAELVSAFVRQTHQSTSALGKHNPDAVWDALRLLLKIFPVRAADLARVRAGRGGGGGEVAVAVVKAAAAVEAAL